MTIMMIKRIFLVLSSLTTTLATLLLIVVVSETIFFDKIIYKKSPFYGYDKNVWIAIKQKNNFIIENRIKDLRQFVGSETPPKNILGNKSDEVYKIALIGDSYVYGLGVMESKTYGRVLENKLNKIRPTKVFVLALPGDSIVENFAKFLLVNSKLYVNLYIFSLVNNDLIYDHNNKYPKEMDVHNFLHNSCHKKEFIYKWNFLDNWEKQLENGVAPSYSDLYSNRCWAETVVREVKKRTPRFFFFSALSSRELDPSFMNGLNNTGLLSRQVENDFIDLVNKNGGFVVNRLDIPTKKVSVSEMEGHPSKELHFVFAESLFQEIVNNPRWGFKD